MLYLYRIGDKHQCIGIFSSPDSVSSASPSPQTNSHNTFLLKRCAHCLLLPDRIVDQHREVTKLICKWLSHVRLSLPTQSHDTSGMTLDWLIVSILMIDVDVFRLLWKFNQENAKISPISKNHRKITRKSPKWKITEKSPIYLPMWEGLLQKYTLTTSLTSECIQQKRFHKTKCAIVFCRSSSC